MTRPFIAISCLALVALTACNNDPTTSPTSPSPEPSASTASFSLQLSINSNGSAQTSRIGAGAHNDATQESKDGVVLLLELSETGGQTGGRIVSVEVNYKDFSGSTVMTETVPVPEQNQIAAGGRMNFQATVGQPGMNAQTIEALLQLSDDNGLTVGASDSTTATFPKTCTSTPTQPCLLDDRFQVEIDWNDGNGQSGMAQTNNLTDDTGSFGFFSPENTDLLVQVLNMCPNYNRFWVFTSGTTNVEFELTVTDSQNGATRMYSNPLGNPFQAITDTSAFATCP